MPSAHLCSLVLQAHALPPFLSSTTVCSRLPGTKTASHGALSLPACLPSTGPGIPHLRARGTRPPAARPQRLRPRATRGRRCACWRSPWRRGCPAWNSATWATRCGAWPSCRRCRSCAGPVGWWVRVGVGARAMEGSMGTVETQSQAGAGGRLQGRCARAAQVLQAVVGWGGGDWAGWEGVRRLWWVGWGRRGECRPVLSGCDQGRWGNVMMEGVVRADGVI